MLRDNYRTIIDGYNLIFQCGLEGRTRDPRAIERARDRLVSSLVRWMDEAARRQIVVVFDATTLPIKETDKVSTKDALTIVFAVEYEDADSLIEELIQKHSSPKQLTVVSSDHRIHKAALRRKATPIDSDAWFDQIETKSESALENEGEAFGEKLEHDSDKEIPDGLNNIDWAKEFGMEDQ